MYLLVRSGKRSENVKLAQELEICAERKSHVYLPIDVHHNRVIRPEFFAIIV